MKYQHVVYVLQLKQPGLMKKLMRVYKLINSQKTTFNQTVVDKKMNLELRSIKNGQQDSNSGFRVKIVFKWGW